MWLRFNPSSVAALGAVVALAVSGCGRGDASQATPAASPAPESIATPASARPAPGPDPIVAAGARAFEHYCQLCHGKDATGYAADNAPSLVSTTFLESATDDFIAAGIRMGRPGTAMAAYGKARGGPLDEREIAAIVHFLRSKGPPVKPLVPASPTGNAARGAELFAQHCTSCHGTPTQRGNSVHLHNPELLAAASPAFLRHAIVHGRPPTPMPSFQGKLDDGQIGDIVAWLWQSKPATPTAPVRNPTVPTDLPLVINPKGAQPQFELREGRFVSSAQVRQALAAKQRIVIIDARPPSDWIQFHIPGAVPVPYHDQTELARVPNDGTWVVAYCACPHHASGEVVDALRRKGYKNTAVLDEGILFWRDRGYPLAGEAVAKPGSSGSASGAAPPQAPKGPAKGQAR